MILAMMVMAVMIAMMMRQTNSFALRRVILVFLRNDIAHSTRPVCPPFESSVASDPRRYVWVERMCSCETERGEPLGMSRTSNSMCAYRMRVSVSVFARESRSMNAKLCNEEWMEWKLCTHKHAHAYTRSRYGDMKWILFGTVDNWHNMISRLTDGYALARHILLLSHVIVMTNT